MRRDDTARRDGPHALLVEGVPAPDMTHEVRPGRGHAALLAATAVGFAAAPAPSPTHAGTLWSLAEGDRGLLSRARALTLALEVTDRPTRDAAAALLLRAITHGRVGAGRPHEAVLLAG